MDYFICSLVDRKSRRVDNGVVSSALGWYGGRLWNTEDTCSLQGVKNMLIKIRFLKEQFSIVLDASLVIIPSCCLFYQELSESFVCNFLVCEDRIIVQIKSLETYSKSEFNELLWFMELPCCTYALLHTSTENRLVYHFDVLNKLQNLIKFCPKIK